MQDFPPVPVALTSCPDYQPAVVRQAVDDSMQAAQLRFTPGDNVLVKPNLLKATADGLPCTHPQVVLALCEHLLDQGCKPFVADSPAFGSGRRVAARIGLAQALHSLGVPLKNLGRPVRRTLPMGISLGIARGALEADILLNAPKLKAHCQMLLTGAVKNLFGCVPGTRKALLHTLHGDQHSAHGPRFESLIIELGQLLPPTVSCVDAIQAMHVRGPSGGRPFALGLLGAAAGSLPLDTALYAVLGVAPEQAPLWRECQRRELHGAKPHDLVYPLASPADFDAAGFKLPGELDPLTFHPLRLGISAMKRAWARIF